MEAEVERQLAGDAPVVERVVIELIGENMRGAGNKVVPCRLRRVSQQHGGHRISRASGRGRVVGEVAIEIKSAERTLRGRRVSLADHVLNHIDAEFEAVRATLPGYVADIFYLVFAPYLRLAPRIA